MINEQYIRFLSSFVLHETINYKMRAISIQGYPGHENSAYFEWRRVSSHLDKDFYCAGVLRSEILCKTSKFKYFVQSCPYNNCIALEYRIVQNVQSCISLRYNIV